jgi:hypothetical protein
VSDVKFTAPLVRVIREGHDVLELQCDNRDMLLWEKTRLRQRPVWPNFTDGPFKWLTFLSWSAARRRGDIPPDYKYETWEDEVLDVSDASPQPATEDEGEDDEVGRPTEPGHDPG